MIRFRQRLTRWRSLVVVAFGPLRGLGFASVLTEIGLSPAHFVTGLIAFNLEVEFGQLTVIPRFFLLIGLWLGHRPWYRDAIAIPTSLAVAFVGSPLAG